VTSLTKADSETSQVNCDTRNVAVSFKSLVRYLHILEF